MKNLVSIKLNGVEQTVVAEIIDKKIWFKINDEIYSYDLLDLNGSHYKKSAAAGKSPDKICAPMPGKVTKIFVSENQVINKGTPLLVMEAMKMEYTFKSDLDGVVEKVNCKTGDQVALGQLLIKLSEGAK